MTLNSQFTQLVYHAPVFIGDCKPFTFSWTDVDID